MTDNAQSISIEELLFTLQTLIAHQQEHLADGKAQGKTNEEHAQQISELVKGLIGLLKTYQDKEQLIIDNTNQAINNNINAAFQKNNEAYHALINTGFTIHIDTATQILSTVAAKVEKQFEDLETAATSSKTEFESRQNVFKLYEDTYDTQSRKLQESVDSTTIAVIKNTKAKLDDIGNDFSYDLAKHLSWKVTAILGAVCLSIMLLTFGSSWLFIPSKDEISTRQAEYNELSKAQVIPSITKRSDGYYARIDSKTCIDNPDPYVWGKSTLCKIK